MRKIFILVLLVIHIGYSSADNLKQKKKNFRLMDESFGGADGGKYPPDIIESIQSDIPGDPQIKIRFAGTEENDGDDDEATISIDTERQNEEEEDEDDDDVPIKRKKLPKSKTDDIHSYL